MKILYFVGTLRSGGKERRLIELLAALKDKENYEILLVLAFNEIDYDYFFDLGINYISLDKKPNCKSLKVLLKLNSIVKKYKPDVIHTWGSMQTFYMALVALFNKIPLINSQITDAPPNIKKISFQNFVNKFNFVLSTVIIANSYAGLKAYKMDRLKKSKVIHNGFAMSRIANLESVDTIREKFGISTHYVVGMVASFSDKKDYASYIRAANIILEKRKDITFLCVGAGDDLPYKKMVSDENKDFIKFLGRQENVESIINICDIGVLMSNPDTHGEGISNAIMEFMALGKPVIASENGGNEEILKNGETGFIINPKNLKILTEKITCFINNRALKLEMGKNGKKRIINKFCINRMLHEFVNLYRNLE